MLTLLRHGRTTANAEGRLQGRLDHPLDELGLVQAAAAAATLGPVDRVISSPLCRAVQTAECFGLPVSIDDRWLELDYGSYDGHPIGDVPIEVWEGWRLNLHFRPPGGETVGELSHRVRAALNELVDEARHQEIVVVTHVSPIKAALAWALGVSDAIAWRCHLSTASMTRVEMSPYGPLLHSFNDVSHLADADLQRRLSWAEREGVVRLPRGVLDPGPRT